MTHQIRFHLLQLSLTPPMGYKCASKASDLDLRVQKAVSAYHNQDFTSIRAAATHFQNLRSDISSSHRWRKVASPGSRDHPTSFKRGRKDSGTIDYAL
jgi:hypothetical protein